MTKVLEFTTWQGGLDWDAKNANAINEGKQFQGQKWTVAIGQWGVRSFLVLGAADKAEAKQLAQDAANQTQRGALEACGAAKITARDVTNGKKYNEPPQAERGGKTPQKEKKRWRVKSWCHYRSAMQILLLWRPRSCMAGSSGSARKRKSVLHKRITCLETLTG